jgi:Na+/proline symporter
MSIVLLTSSSKGIANVSSEASSEQKISGIALFAMVFGTLFTATSLFGTAGQVKLFGFSYFAIACSDVIRTLIIALFIKKIYIYKKYLSVGEAIGDFYGRSSRFITGVCCLIFSVIIIAIQFQWAYKTIDHLFNVNFNVGLLMAAFLSICYCLNQSKIFSPQSLAKALFLFLISSSILHYLCCLNQKLVVFSAVVGLHSLSSIYPSSNQSLRAMLCFSFMILLLPIIFSGIEALDIPLDRAILSLSKQIESLKSDLFHVENISVYSAIFLSTAIPIFNPLVIQRMRLASSASQARKVFVIASLALFVFAHLVSLCSVASSNIYPEMSASNSFNSFLYLINNVVDTPIFKGVAVCGILSVMFSTIEPGIITANSAILNDICNHQMFLKADPKKQDLIIKISTVFIFTSALLLASFVVKTTQWLMFAVNLWASIVTVPFVAGIYGLRASEKVFYMSAASGIVVNIFYYYVNYHPIKIIGVVASSLIMNSLVLLISKIIFSPKVNKQY